MINKPQYVSSRLYQQNKDADTRHPVYWWCCFYHSVDNKQRSKGSSALCWFVRVMANPLKVQCPLKLVFTKIDCIRIDRTLPRTSQSEGFSPHHWILNMVTKHSLTSKAHSPTLAADYSRDSSQYFLWHTRIFDTSNNARLSSDRCLVYLLARVTTYSCF